MYTGLKWAIKLNKDRSAKHAIEVEVFDFQHTSDFTTRLSFPAIELQQIDKIITVCGKDIYPWKRNPLAGGQEKRYSFDVQELTKKKDFQNASENIKFRIEFDEANAISQYGELYVVSLHYNCMDLRAHSMEVCVHFPVSTNFTYYIRKTMIKLFRKKANLGIYRLYEGKGGQIQRWDYKDGGRDIVLGYRSPRANNGFPCVGFAFEEVKIHFTRFLITFFSGIFFIFILPIILNLVSGNTWVKTNFDRFWDFMFSLGRTGG